MPNTRASSVATMEEPRDAAGVVEAFLHASMVPDPQTAARYIADDLKITFTGGRKYRHPRETTAFNAKRYKWVKKKMERTDVVAGEGETIVYNLGTLYGEWPDGTSVRRQPLRRPLRRARRQDRANGRLERQRRAPADQGRDRGLVLVTRGPDQVAARLCSLPLGACAACRRRLAGASLA